MKILLQTIKILFDKVSSRGLDESEERETITCSYLKRTKYKVIEMRILLWRLCL